MQQTDWKIFGSEINFQIKDKEEKLKFCQQDRIQFLVYFIALSVDQILSKIFKGDTEFKNFKDS